MRRNVSIIISILIGALAVGLGMGFFLLKANGDRERLAAVAEAAKRASEQAQAASRQAVEEAKNKLEQANAEVAKAQSAMEKLAEERRLMASAEVLYAPKNLKGWKEAVSVPLGVALKFPPRTEIENNSSDALTLIYSTASSSSSPIRWFSLTPYDERLEKELAIALYSTSTANFLVKGRVLNGIRGYSSGTGEDTYILRLLESGSAERLVWIRGTGKNGQIQPIQILSTLDFQ